MVCLLCYSQVNSPTKLWFVSSATPRLTLLLSYGLSPLYSQVNEMEMSGVTREDAVLYLMSLQEQIELIVQSRQQEYQQILAEQKGDMFYIK